MNLYKLEIFKDDVTEPLNVQISNLLKVSQRQVLSPRMEDFIRQRTMFFLLLPFQE